MITGSRILIVPLLLIASPAVAELIDFETVPGVGTPFEGLTISDQYAATHGVTFSLLGGGAPVVAEVGPPTTAFQGPPNHSGSDNPVPGQGIGQFFLTDDGQTVGIDPLPLVVDYDPPASEASGVILDMDVDESFTIEAFDEVGASLAVILIQSGDPFTGDGIATPWNMVRPTPEIARLVFTGDRSTPGFFGLGFDNFDARAAPDSDGDGVFDNMDNCTGQANADQRDTNGDGFGNHCDADLNDDCMINFGDVAAFKSVFLTSDADADFDGDGEVNFGDLAVMKASFLDPPGPSGVLNDCDP